MHLYLEGIRASISKETYIATCDFPWGPPPSLLSRAFISHQGLNCLLYLGTLAPFCRNFDCQPLKYELNKKSKQMLIKITVLLS